jgi:hypothetical protein
MNGLTKRSYRSGPTAGSAIRFPIALGRSDGAPALAYRDEDRGWWLWSPCPACGGTELPLRDRGLVADLLRLDGPLDSVCDLTRTLCEDDAVECRCPNCEAHRRRRQDPGKDPAIWYDPPVTDWVVQMGVPGCREAVLLPLEVHWFDADWAEVYRAASDLAHSGERFAELADSPMPVRRRRARTDRRSG